MALRGAYVVRGASAHVSADRSATTNSTNTAQRIIARTRGMETTQYARDQRPFFTDTGWPSTWSPPPQGWGPPGHNGFWWRVCRSVTRTEFSLTWQEAPPLLSGVAKSPFCLAPEDFAEGGLP